MKAYLTRLPGRRFLTSLTNRPRTAVQAGQPLHETRPFLLKPGELTPGITALEYFERRIRLASKLPAGSLVVIAGGQIQYSSGSVFHPFQQNNDLYYLSGWNEPNSVLLLHKPTDNLDDVSFHMCVPEKDDFAEKWEGFRTGTVNVQEYFNADESCDINLLPRHLAQLLKHTQRIYYDAPKEKDGTAKFLNNFFSKPNSLLQLETLAQGVPIHPLKPHLSPLRAIKSPAEIAVMRQAGRISGRAYNQAYAKRFNNERTLESFLGYKFTSLGCDKHAYIPVVATGSNALCIHYTRNDDVLYDDEMVLVDAAGSLGGYNADISRTWPNSGKFTSAQRELYEVVLTVQEKCIELCTEASGMALHDIHNASVNYFVEELKQVGLDLSRKDVNKLYPHYIGHNLGLDVHDVPDYSRFVRLREGQVITIEPGIYFPDEPEYPAEFRNIGIRIEDDIAVGKSNYRILTVEAAKEIEDIESIAQRGVTTPYEEDVLEVL